MPDAAYSLRGHRDDVVRIIGKLELNDVVLMGHSFGGFVSLSAVPHITHPLAALILVDSRGHIRPRAARYLSALSRFPNPAYSSEEEAVKNFQLLPRETTARAEVLDHVARNSLRQLDDGRWTLSFDRMALRAARECSFEKEMRDLDRPALVVRGEHSTALSRRGLAALASEIPQAVTAEIADAHHHLTLDQPEAFAAAVLNFLAQSLPNKPAAE